MITRSNSSLSTKDGLCVNSYYARISLHNTIVIINIITLPTTVIINKNVKKDRWYLWFAKPRSVMQNTMSLTTAPAIDTYLKPSFLFAGRVEKV